MITEEDNYHGEERDYHGEERLPRRRAITTEENDYHGEEISTCVDVSMNAVVSQPTQPIRRTGEAAVNYVLELSKTIRENLATTWTGNSSRTGEQRMTATDATYKADGRDKP